MRMKINYRRLLAISIIIITIAAAAFFSLPRPGSTFNPAPGEWAPPLPLFLDQLLKVEELHIVLHLVIFGTVAFLLRAWRSVMLAGIVLELVQFAVTMKDDPLSMFFQRAVFDIVINSIGVLIGYWLAIRLDKPNERYSGIDNSSTM